MLSRHSRKRRAPLSHHRHAGALLIAALALTLAGHAHAQSTPGPLPGPAGPPPAQSTSGYSFGYQYRDAQSTYSSNVRPDCSSNGTVLAQFGCTYTTSNGGMASASGLSSFDAATGTFKSGAFLSAQNYTLSQFVPQFDLISNRIYTGQSRPDVLGVQSAMFLSDQLVLAHTAGAPATLTLQFALNGALHVDAMPPGGTADASSLINFCTGPSGFCGDPAHFSDVFSGNAGFRLDQTGLDRGFSSSSSAPPGANPASIMFDGTTGAAPSGTLTLADVPLTSAMDLYDFVFVFGTSVSFYHPTVGLGHITEGCDPAQDSACASVAPIDVTGDFFADFTHSLTFTGFQAFDDNGLDISQSVQLKLKGANLSIPPIGATFAAPEPATWLLFGAGLLAMGPFARRAIQRQKIIAGGTNFGA